MTQRSNNINIKNPCHLQWKALQGNGCVRYCSHCSTNVVDLTSKSNKEIIEVVMKSRGRICGRIRQDQFDHVIKTNRKNASVLKTLGVFILGLATVTTSNATLLPLTSSKVEQLNTLVYEFENLGSNFVKQDSIFTFSGIVVDPASESELPSVNISLKGTDLGTITDASGKFEFVVTPEQLKNSKNTLVFSFIGFKTTEIELSNRSITDMKIEMSTDVVWLGEIRIPWYKRLWWTITSPFRNG